MKKLQHNNHSERAENDAGHKHEACKARDPDLIHHRPHLVKHCSDLLKHRATVQDVLEAPHRSTMHVKIFRTLRTGARFSYKFSRCSARERDFVQNFQDAPHGSTIFIFIKIFKTLRTGARFFSKFSRRSARERDFSQDFHDAPHGSAALIKRERS